MTLRKFKAAHAGAVKKAAKTTVLKKNARAAAKSVKSIVAHYRPDLQSVSKRRRETGEDGRRIEVVSGQVKLEEKY